MKRITYTYELLLVIGFVGLLSCSVKQEKQLYCPKEFAVMNWESDTARYSYKRMACTENLAIFWEKGFGVDLANPPQLEGHAMQVDLENLKQKLETFYTFYRDSLQYVKPGSKSEKYRMMVMLQYSLEGTAYGGDYDQEIGAFWAAPNRLQDKNLNAVAHELGHSFQLQLIADGEGVAWGGNGIYEMGAQWMLWHVNPHWIDDETYHWEAFKKATHKAFLHIENIYRSPYVLEYWSERKGLPFIAELFRQGKEEEDPVMTYQRMENLTQKQFNDEMFDAYQHLVNFDYKRVYDVTRSWANSFPAFKEYMEETGEGWLRVKKDKCPENYGFNAIQLSVPEEGSTVTIDFQGLTNVDGYNIIHPDKSGWRYGFVGITQAGRAIRGEVCCDSSGKAVFTVPTSQKLSYLWFVVMGAPTEHWMNPDRRGEKEPELDAQWPYQLKVTGTNIL